ncbi:restriction endonuclease subunit S [Lactococcus lactis]|uniref:restriction endonuclease subunit S n=1 Tax=Lactococcus lactis TaxID=1358 RepID=UPI0024A93969|nr:restriction endonuclease subunit S [Lactococcus lactis]
MTSENNLYVEKNKAEVSKKVPELRFQGFIDAWEQRKLGELLTEVKRPIKMQDDDTYQLVTVKRRNEGIVSRGLFQGKQILVKNYFELYAGDYLISKRQVVHGANGIVPKDMEGAIVSNEYLVSVGNNNITTDFLTIISKLPIMYKMFFLSSYGIDIEKLVFNVNDWKKREISIPSLQEQDRISSFFKQLDDTIALHQRKLDKLKRLKQGYLQQLFPENDEKVPRVRFANFEDEWELRKLGELTTSFSGGTPSAGNSSYYKGDIPFIRSGEINSDKTELFLTEAGLKNSSAKMVSVGDVLYALYGATSGEVGISQINGAINQAILAIKPCDGYNSHFLMQWLKLQKQKIIDKYLQGGQGNLSGSIVKNLVLNVPNFEEQKKIGAFFKQLDDTITLHQSKLDKLNLLKQALLQKMFI